ncbi:Aminoethylphosphonate catabolism LysR family transcriptional regulator [Hyphomicrobiales bacterium]|nr:Aminoethylphosphonate catabolism LysR family transcriptional regulator [Hyphomicrobiales bacterium]CAH1701666.1 Aminoethylphosphonate catabolism LysR family transcriptional regulator [Hyphomicrobiales bacterium]CAI0345832.1 Aminoethylphosphonate catabolism LysR family transcriptional regulator [Hyphomicrobiales bacterium]
MRYVQLRAFHHVAISGGFSKAAHALHLTQPAISDQVRKLEEEYDVALFSRRHRQIVLTPAGHRLLAVTRRLFGAEDQALELLQEERSLRTGTLRIVADSVHHVLDVLTAFRERYPGIQVSIARGNTGSIVDTLTGYDAEIGVLGELVDERPFAVLPLNVSPIIAFAAKAHPAATGASFSLQDLAGWPLVMRERGSRTRQLLEQRATEQGVALRFAVEAEGREAVRAIVAAGDGIGFVSAAEFGEDDPQLTRIALDGPPLLMHEKLICLHERRNSKTIQAFFALAQSLRG